VPSQAAELAQPSVRHCRVPPSLLAPAPACCHPTRTLQATGRKKLLIAGIVTDVCVLFPTLSALAEGFEVYVVVDASGTFNKVVRDAALMRATAAGAVLINWFAVACELQKDWRLGPNAGQVRNGSRLQHAWGLRPQVLST
jgi:hypothetical protein